MLLPHYEKKFTFILTLMFLFALTASAPAQTYARMSSRGAALGEGYGAVADDASGVFYNPAGIGFLKGYQFSGMFNRISAYNMPSDENPFTGVFGGSKYKEGWGVFALHIARFGSFASSTTLNTTNYLTMSYARAFKTNLSGGLNLKYLFESNYGKRKAADLDLGFLYKYNRNINVGLAVNNALQSEMTPVYAGTNYYLDRIFRASLLYKKRHTRMPTNFLLAAGFKNQKLGDTSDSYGLFSLGAEQWLNDNSPKSWAFRMSYTLTKDQGDNARYLGLGISYLMKSVSNYWRFDYSFQEYPYSGPGVTTGDHFISVIYGFYGSEQAALFSEKQKEAPSEEQISEEYADLRPLRPLQPKTSEPVEEKKYVSIPPVEKQAMKMNIRGRVEDLSSTAGKQYMFLLEPGIRFKPEKWKLFIHKKQPKPTSLENIAEMSVRTFVGDGDIPQVIVWDGKDTDYRVCKGGRYYYSLWIWDPSDQLWRTNWYSFKVR